MRESLTVIAILLIAVLTAALVGPYFVDWTAHRDWIEARLSEATGGKVTVAGVIDVKLLPVPRLVLNNVVFQGKEPGDFRLAADNLRLEMAIAPLMRGDVSFIEADIEAPKLALTVDAGGGVALPHPPVRLAGQVAFERIRLHDGSITISDPHSDRSIALAGLDLDAEAGSLAGPFRASGSVARGTGRLAFNFSTGTLDGNRLRLRFISDAARTAPRVELDGALVLTPHPAATTALAFEGTGNLSGTAPIGDGLPWRIAAGLHADWSGATMDNIEIRGGEDGRALTATGTAAMTFGGEPALQMQLTARQIDLDRMSGHADADGAGGQIAASLAAFIRQPGNALWPVATTLDFSAPTLTIAGDTLTDFTLHAAVANRQPIALALDVNGAGRSRLSLNGAVEAGPAAAFTGHLSVSARDIDRLADWLSAFAPDAAGRLRALPVRALAVDGDMQISPAGFVGRDLAVTADRSRMTGFVAFTRTVGANPARLYADLRSDALDLDALPALDGPTAAAAGIDLALSLDACAIRVARFGDGILDAGHIAVKLTRTGDEVRLDNLEIANLGGASLVANGEADTAGSRINLDLDAGRLTDFAALLVRIAPGPASQMLAARAAALSPVKLHLQAQTTSAGRTFAIDGTLRGTRLRGSAEPDAADSRITRAKISLDAPETPLLLRQLGMNVLSIGGYGHGRIDLSLRGTTDGYDAALDAALAGAMAHFDGRLGGSLAAPFAQGAVHVAGDNIAPLLQVVGLATPDLTSRMAGDLDATFRADGHSIAVSSLSGRLGGAHLSGAVDLALSRAAEADSQAARLTGTLGFDRLSVADLATLALGPTPPIPADVRWPEQKFAPAGANPPRSDIAMKVAELVLAPGIVARNAAFDLDLAPGLVGVDRLTSELAGSRLDGHATLRRDGATASLAGTLNLSKLAIEEGGASSVLSGAVDFSATGGSVASLVGGLAGSGSITLADLMVPRGDPSALSRIVAAVDRGNIAIGESEIRNALDREFSKAPLRLGERRFELNAATGVLRLASKDAAATLPDAMLGNVSATLDARTLALDGRVALTWTAPPKDWGAAPAQVTIALRGPVGAPARTVDAAAFVNALSARAIAHEAARIEAFDADVRERAAFARRLKGLQFMRQRDQEVKQFLDDQARQAAEDQRRKAFEAASAQRAISAPLSILPSFGSSTAPPP